MVSFRWPHKAEAQLLCYSDRTAKVKRENSAWAGFNFFFATHFFAYKYDAVGFLPQKFQTLTEMEHCTAAFQAELYKMIQKDVA